jgi:hypothetical protein
VGREGREDAGDYFAFAIVGTEELSEAGVRLALRYKLESTLSGRTFEPLEVDVSIASPEPWDAEPVQRPGVFAELGFAPIEMSLVPVARQVAEKLHAYTRRYKGGGTTRARDLVDLLLIRQYERMEPAALKNAISRVFARRQTHAVPARLPTPPRELAVSYKREAERVRVNPVLAEAHQLVAAWLDPLLDEIARTGGGDGAERT